MKKPINKFAVVLWMLALVLLICEAIPITTQLQSVWQTRAGDSTTGTLWFASNMIRSAVAPSTMLAAFGYFVELLDEIRWNTRRE